MVQVIQAKHLGNESYSWLRSTGVGQILRALRVLRGEVGLIIQAVNNALNGCGVG
jgi:hypothetical protein